MAMTLLAGRIFFALIFVLAAPRHFSKEAVRHAADLGVPLASVLVPLSGLMALAGGVSVIFGFKARYGALLLAAFLVPVTLMMHAFWVLKDPAQIHVQRGMFFKNLSLIGTALMLSQWGAGPLSVDGY